MGRRIDEAMLCADDAQERIQEIIRGLAPFVEFLNGIVMPDPNAEDSSEDEEDGDEGEDE